MCWRRNRRWAQRQRARGARACFFSRRAGESDLAMAAMERSVEDESPLDPLSGAMLEGDRFFVVLVKGNQQICDDILGD